ncbi:MAG TPA: heme-copper oxidase subunit III [Candidatus Binataceae bacterium]|nr:heme-copper oxidase subunit III [Candidatus Binataceae bacterium]
MSESSTAVGTPEPQAHGGFEDAVETPLTPGSRGKLGMWIFLVGDATTFGTVIAAYAALRIGNLNWPLPSTILGIPATALMTFVLICSSMTMVQALAAIRQDRQLAFRVFLFLTVVGGLLFLGLQAREWHHLIFTRGLSIKTSLFSATFFLLTGFHGCHVIAGVLLLSVLLIRGLLGKLGAAQARTVEVAGLYWHFVDLVWILIFTFVYLI